MRSNDSWTSFNWDGSLEDLLLEMKEVRKARTWKDDGVTKKQLDTAIDDLEYFLNV